jgi:hypothetical protein
MDIAKFLELLPLSNEDALDAAKKLEAEAVTFTQLLTTIDRADLEELGISNEVCSRIITMRQVIIPGAEHAPGWWWACLSHLNFVADTERIT